MKNKLFTDATIIDDVDFANAILKKLVGRVENVQLQGKMKLNEFFFLSSHRKPSLILS